MLQEKRDKETRKDTNYVFYVSDMEELPTSGHFRKMDAGREIAEHVCGGLHGGILKKYTEYEGELLAADSVGIVFPTHMWGCSLAVYAFLKHLRVKEGTYIYAVAVGESLSGAVYDTLQRRLNSLEEFKRIFIRRGFGTESDIYVRCIDKKRMIDETESGAAFGVEKREQVSRVLSKLLYHDILSVLTDEEYASDMPMYGSVHDVRFNRAFHRPAPVCTMLSDDDATENGISAHGKKESRRTENSKTASGAAVAGGNLIKLTNVYLDESFLSGVRLCRVM